MRKIILIFLLVIFSLTIPSIVLALDKLDGPYSQRVYVNWDNQNYWLIVEAYATVVGERYVYASNPNSTVLTHQAITYGINKDPNLRFAYVCSFIASTREHIIRVSAIPYTPVRITDTYAYDNAQTTTVNAYVRYALDILWNFAISYSKLPLPSPWGLISQSPPRIEIQRDLDLRGATFKYNYNPTLQGADWLWYVDKPVNINAWYFIDVHARGEAGVIQSCPGLDPSFLKEGDIDILLYADFYVYNATAR